MSAYPFHSLDHSLLWSILAVTSNIGSIASTSLMYHTKSLTTVASLLARFGMACVVGFYTFFPTTKNEEMEQTKSEDASSRDSRDSGDSDKSDKSDKSSPSIPWKRELICLVLCYITQFLVRSINHFINHFIIHSYIDLSHSSYYCRMVIPLPSLPILPLHRRIVFSLHS